MRRLRAKYITSQTPELGSNAKTVHTSFKHLFATTLGVHSVRVTNFAKMMIAHFVLATVLQATRSLNTGSTP